MVKIMQIDDFWKGLLVNLIWTNWVRSLFILHAINLTLDFVLAQEHAEENSGNDSSYSNPLPSKVCKTKHGVSSNTPTQQWSTLHHTQK